MKRVLSIVLIFLLILILTGCTSKEEENTNKKIVTSFYPIYIMAINILQDIPGISIENMTDITIGCLHNYTLQTSDLKKVEKADIFIKNGLGLENFMDKITSNYPKIKIIDTSNTKLDIINDEEGENGHVWNNIENYKKQVNYICNELVKINPEKKDKYVSNTNEYIKKIDGIEKYKAEKQYVISCNEALAYLLEEANLEILPVYTDHDESSLSSAKLAEVINIAREKNIKVIFIDKNDDVRNANLIANEIGAEIVRLDSCLTGNLEKNAYIDAMNNNFKLIKNILEK